MIEQYVPSRDIIEMIILINLIVFSLLLSIYLFSLNSVRGEEERS